MLEFRILGPLEVLDGDSPVRLGGPKQRAVLAILLLNANRVVPVERLADDLYAGAPPVTAVTQVQRQVSELRKLLGAAAIETRPPGYLVRVEPDGLDLDRFERWTGDAALALEHGDAERAVEIFQRALALWRGSPLADAAYEPFAQTAIARLEELRLAALEGRIEAELALGRQALVLAELEALVWDHPLRERLRAQLMLALYRSGRQAEALDVYRNTRDALVKELGIEPSRSLVELERRILSQDPGLELPQARPHVERSLLVVATHERELDGLIAIAAPLASLPDRALIMARLVEAEAEVARTASALEARRASLVVPARTAAFTSREPARDVVRLATTYDAELILLGEPTSVDELAAIVAHSPSDLAALHGGAPSWERSGVFVPFGGGENDWAALEVGAWLASSAGVPLRLVGTGADPNRGQRDASRLLADASLATQRVVGVAAEPLLVEPAEDALLAACEPASIVVTGFPSRWRSDGLGSVRTALVHASDRTPVLLVQRGTRPGGLAPRESRTRFSWSLEP